MPETPLRLTCNRPSVSSPLWTAAGTSLAYLLLCVLYIIISSRYAANVAVTQHDQQRIETIKGIAFITVTSLVYFAISFALYKRIRRQQATIAAQEVALLKTERKIMGAMSFAVMAHDLNNLLMPLAVIARELHDQGKGTPALQKNSEELANGLRNLSNLCKRIASSTSQVLPDIEEPIYLNDALPKLAALARKHPDARSCTITVPDMPPMTLVLNRVLLEEAVLNLLVNAAQAAGPQGIIELRVLREPHNALIAVHDNGPGVPAEKIESIFDPCFTTKPEGTGIGLVAVKAFASSCNGEITVGKSPLGGALFQISIPVNHRPPNQAPADAIGLAAP